MQRSHHPAGTFRLETWSVMSRPPHPRRGLGVGAPGLPGSFGGGAAGGGGQAERGATAAGVAFGGAKGAWRY